MPKYEQWTVQACEESARLILLIDETEASIYLDGKVESQRQSKASFITAVERDAEDGNDLLKIHIGNISVKLSAKRFKPATVFGCTMKNGHDLSKFWENFGSFIVSSEVSKSLGKESLEIQDNSVKGSNLEELTEYPNHNLTEKQLSSSLVLENTFHETCERKDAFINITEKNVGHFFIDIYQMEDPPKEYQVRKKNTKFIEDLSEKMILKNSVSIDNAPNIIGFISTDKTQFDKQNIHNYKIYIIDGNHSVNAQRLAYDKTKDLIFKFRTVNIYCNLTSEEALLLGISRNEDAENILKMTDFDKIDLIRRQLFSITDTPYEEEPPEPTPEFSVLYRKLLNLQQKKDVDSKAILRFVATKFSNRCYKIFSDLCVRNNKTKASKFEPVRGLEENDQYECLSALAKTQLTQADWRKFRENCLEKKSKKVFQDLVPTIEFEKNQTILKIEKKGVFITPCYKFVLDGEIVCKSHAELKDIIFDTSGSRNDKSPGIERKRNVYSFASECSPVKAFRSTPLRSRKRYQKHQKSQKMLTKEISSSDSSDTSIDTKIEKKGKYRHSENNRKSSEFDDSMDFCPKKMAKTVEQRYCENNLGREKQEEIVSEKSISSKSDMQVLEGMITTDMPVLTQCNVKEFLMPLVEEKVLERAVNGNGLIDEHEIEIIPESVLQQASILTNKNLQKASKQYFTEDGWLTAISVIKIVQEKYDMIGKETAQTNEEVNTYTALTKENITSTDSLPQDKQKKYNESCQKDEKKSRKRCLEVRRCQTENGITKECRVRITDIGPKNIKHSKVQK